MAISELSTKIADCGWLDVTWTGGEPTLQKSEMIECIHQLSIHTHHLETNGHKRVEPHMFGTVVVSPKMDKFNEDVIEFYKWHENVYWKFVVENEHEFNYWSDFVVSRDINPRKVYMMPKCTTREKQLCLLEPIALQCIKEGYNLSPRLHVLIWNNKRGV